MGKGIGMGKEMNYARCLMKKEGKTPPFKIEVKRLTANYGQQACGCGSQVGCGQHGCGQHL